MAGEGEVTKAIRAGLYRIGFEPPPMPVVKGTQRLRVSSDRVGAAVAGVLDARDAARKATTNTTANRWLHQGATADNDLRKRGWTEGEIEVDRHHREARARREGERLGAAVGDALHHPPIHRLPMDVELSGDFCLAHPLLEERGRFEPPSFERIEIPPHPHRIHHAARIAQSDALVTILREIQ